MMVGNDVIIFRIISVTWARMERWNEFKQCPLPAKIDRKKVKKTE